MNLDTFPVPSLPSYVRQWKGEVRRATQEDLVGREYDDTITIERIFWYRKPGAKDESLAVRSRCNNCKANNKPCIRLDPCNSCYYKKMRCTYPASPMGLPEKPVRGEPRLVLRDANIPYARDDLELDDRSGNFSQSSISIVGSEPRRTKRERKTKKKQDAPALPMEITDVQSTPPSGKKGRVAKARVSRKGNVSWTAMPMNDGVSIYTIPKKSEFRRMPYLWAEMFTDLCGAVPLLSTMGNGVSAEVGPSPLILLNNEWWSGSWDGSHRMKLTTDRIFSCSEPSVSSIPGSPVVLKTAAAKEASTSVFETEIEDADMDVNSDDDLQYPDQEEGEILNDAPGYSMSINDMWDIFPGRAGGIERAIDSFKKLPPSSDQKFPTFAPERRPEEIETLNRAHEGRMPVSVITETDWLHFPFILNERCKYAVLGFFHITNIETSVSALPSSPTKSKSIRSRGRISWSFELEWIRAGPLDLNIPWDIDGRRALSPPLPWWMTDEHRLMPSSLSEAFYEPYLVSAELIAPSVFHDSLAQKADASKRAWLCTNCGKLSATEWLGTNICSFCQTKLPWSRRIITPFSVRDRCRFIPAWEPSTQIPGDVAKEMRILEDEVRLFAYTLILRTLVGKGGEVELHDFPEDANLAVSGSGAMIGKSSHKGKGKAIHPEMAHALVPMCIDSPAEQENGFSMVIIELIFLGNRPHLESEANTLFVDFQKDCPMWFSRTVSKPTAGIYAFQAILSGQNNETYSNLNATPMSVRRAREIMLDYAKRYAKKDGLEHLMHLSALAWLGESPVKVEVPVPAKENPVLLMCMGADLHIIFPNQLENAESTSMAKSRKVRRKGGDAEQEQISYAGINGEKWGDGSVGETNKALTASDRLRITLSHGSVMVISGFDLCVTAMRTDFAILLRLYDGR